MATIGGIVAVNSGKISDCYAIWNAKHNHDSRLIIGKNNGSVLTSLLVYKGECCSIFDTEGTLHENYSIQKTSDIKSLGFDTKQCWEYVGNNSLLNFNSSHWYKASVTGDHRFSLHIKTVAQYLTFAEKVNAGDQRYITAKVYLDCDLNFKGKRIPIIGKKRECAFAGIFDGQGHMVWNGIIRDDNTVYAGMFGCLKGTVVNVTFDGRVIGNNNLGGLCGYNMGTILCCGSVARICAKDDRHSIGGLAAQNEGVISRCYAVLEPKKMLPPVVPLILTSLLFIFIGSLGYFTILKAINTTKEYATIEVDPRQEKVDSDADTDSDIEKDGSNSISFTLDQVVKISRSAGTCELDFINPVNNSNKIVVEVQLVNVAGERATIARSKAVLPGYKLESVSLNDSAYDVITGTETDGYVVLVSYDCETESKAMIQTELPVKIVFAD